MFDVAKFMARSLDASYSEQRGDVISLRFRLLGVIEQADEFDIDLFQLLNLGYEDQWKLLGFPWWSARRGLTEDQQSLNQRKHVKTKQLPPWEEGTRWVREFCGTIEVLISERRRFPNEDAFLFTLMMRNDTLPKYRKAMVKLRKLWRSRPKECRPPTELLARLPSSWDDGPQF